MNGTLFMIKPDGMPFSEEILRLLDTRGRILDYAPRKIFESAIDCLYSQMDKDPVFFALREYLNENYCGIGIIDCSIDSVLEITGKNTDPIECEINTIRFNYGAGWGYTKSGLSVL